MEHRIEYLEEKKLLGMHLGMTLAGNRTRELWQSFMPRLHEIQNRAGKELISMQVYPPGFNIQEFGMQTEFEKWACTELNSLDHIPEGMESFLLPAGLYAVFLHKGPASRGAESFRYIFGNWLPHSGYVLDQRPHFELLGEKYKNESPDSEEEIWIPVREKE